MPAESRVCWCVKMNDADMITKLAQDFSTEGITKRFCPGLFQIPKEMLSRNSVGLFGNFYEWS